MTIAKLEREARPTERADLHPAGNDASRLASRLFLASVAAALLPVVVATARAIARGWVPVADNGWIAVRTYDVLTEHHPLLGTGSSAGLTAGTEIHHPGPLLHDLLALPARIVPGSGTGLALGVGIVNCLAVVGIAVFAHRRGGPLLATGAMAVTAALAWAMGSEVLFEPWQPHVLLLPFLLFLVLVWSVACGDLSALPWAAGVGSLVVQTHLSYALLAPVLALWAVVVLILELRRRRARDPESWPGLRRRARRVGTLTAAVLAVLWLQPVVEQLFSDGNLGQLVRAGNGPESIGYGRGVRLVATVVAVPPWWLRPSFHESLFASDRWEPPSLVAAAVSLALLALVLAVGAANSRRRCDRPAFLVVATAAMALVVGLVTVGQGPVSFFGITAHQFRWLWPLGAFGAFGILVVLVRRLAPRLPPTRLVGLLTLVTAGFALLNLPTSDQGSQADTGAVPVARDLANQMDTVEGEGTLMVDLPLLFGEPYGPAVLAELARREVAFVVEPVWLSQLDDRRRFTGRNADAVLSFAFGDAARRTSAGARRIAFHEGLDDEEQRELAALERVIGEFVAAGRLRPNRRGERAIGDGDLPTLAEQSAADIPEAEPLFESRELVSMVRDDLLDLAPPWAGRFARYAHLQTRWDDETIALFLEPLAGRRRPSE